ncbi:MAG: tetratricopeptide repeat protein [Melioribacteraceae bacterium]|nr:tetratricopeptide repeat protein [Melioribacteraceae bacterium]
MINDRYKILEPLGEGHSKVYRCSDQNFPGKDFAIKILPPAINNLEIEALKSEFFILKKLYHPNIIKPHEYGTVIKITGKENDEFEISEGSKFFTQEYFDGKELLSHNLTENEDNFNDVLKQICSVLFYLHQSNFIYFDLKPQNILINSANGKFQIKFIDFGLTKHCKLNKNINVQGSPYFIAPEIVAQKEVDHRVDFYSFGILLYRIIYGYFPFEGKNGLSLLKSPLDDEIIFNKSPLSNNIIDIIKKLVSKDRNNRYFSALEIILDLGFEIDNEISKNFTCARTVSPRINIQEQLKKYLSNEHSGKVLLLRGDEGAGKSTFLEDIHYTHPDVIFIEKDISNIGVEFWKYFLRKLFYSEFIFKSLGNNMLYSIINILEHETSDLLTILKSIFRNITIQNKFVLLLDDFNRYDYFSIEIFKQLLPILQINNIKIIIAEDPTYPSVTDFINNVQTINLSPFTEEEFDYYIENSFADFFPKKAIKRIINEFADFLPGNIDSFFRDLLILKLIDYKSGYPIFKGSEVAVNILKKSQNEIYKLRITELNEHEYKTASILSLFESGITEDLLSNLLEAADLNISNIIEGLREKNILIKSNISVLPKFVSQGIQKFIFSHIQNRKELHKILANKIYKNHPHFNRAELARQFELGREFEMVSKILLEDLDSVEKSSSMDYQKTILTHLVQLPLSNNVLSNLYFRFCQVLFKLAEHKLCFEISNKIDESLISEKQTDEILIIRGKCLINIGKLDLGKDLLNLILLSIKDQDLKLEILLDIATGELEEDNFKLCENIANEVISTKTKNVMFYGDAYNLLALSAIHSKNDLHEALNSFNKALELYENSGEIHKVAGMEINLGNIRILMDDLERATKHWDRALKINSNIGNLDKEARIFLGYGVFYLRKYKYEEAIINYKKALNIFKNIGDGLNSGICLANLGEVKYLNCEYIEAQESFSKALSVFRKVKNYNEVGEALLNLAIMYFHLNDVKKMDHIAVEYFELFRTNLPIKKHKTNLDLINILRSILTNNLDKIELRIESVKNAYSKVNEISKYSFCMKLLSTVLIEKGFEDRCLAEIREPMYIEICRENLLFKAQRQYILGKIAQINKNLKLKPAIEYYKSAFNIIENESITELTWEVTVALSELYYERGNYLKAGEFTFLSKKLLEEITSKIKSNDLKKYLNSVFKKSSIEKLNYFAEQCGYA